MLGCHQQQNLGERARAKAVTMGVILSGVAMLWALLATELHFSKPLGWLIGLPIACSAYLLISGTFGICVYNGIKGSRMEDYGGEAVLDPERRAQLRFRSYLAICASLAIAVTFAAVFVNAS